MNPKYEEFILELGKNFIYIDEEYRLQVGNSDFRIDLLFYHRELEYLLCLQDKRLLQQEMREIADNSDIS